MTANGNTRKGFGKDDSGEQPSAAIIQIGNVAPTPCGSGSQGPHKIPHAPFTGCSDSALERVMRYPQLLESISQRFWRMVDKGEPDECWSWLGSSNHGYGRFKLVSHTCIGAHRMSYALAYGEKPGALHVLHRCDNPPCVNPAHLFLGTNADNVADKIAKGRQPPPRDQRGSKNGAAKLNEAQVAVIRERIGKGHNNQMIAADYGVTHQLISRIRRGRSWGAPPMQAPYAHLRRGG